VSGPQTFDSLEDQLRRSILYRTLDALAAAWATAEAHSRVVARVRSIAVGLVSTAPAKRLRASSMCAATFATATAALQRVVPPQVAPAVPITAWIAVAAAAAIAALLAEPLTQAWPASRCRRWLQLRS
jgi:hypothetical protein